MNSPILSDVSRSTRRDVWRTAIAAATVLLIGLADYLSGPLIAFSLFYLMPVSAVAWNTKGRANGVAIAMLSASVWLIAEMGGRQPGIHEAIVAWNGITRLTIFVAIAWLLSTLRAALAHERALARTDFLTGALNARAFTEIAEAEIARARRYGHPLAVAYADLDNFKEVNDQRGHSQGDLLLRVVATTLRDHLRQSDIVARLGGDEFVLLLPETGHAEAEQAMTKVQARLTASMKRHDWPVTFSIGVVAFDVAPQWVDELIHAADRHMYAAKAAGKNRVSFARELDPLTTADETAL